MGTGPGAKIYRGTGAKGNKISPKASISNKYQELNYKLLVVSHTGEIG